MQRARRRTGYCTGSTSGWIIKISSEKPHTSIVECDFEFEASFHQLLSQRIGGFGGHKCSQSDLKIASGFDNEQPSLANDSEILS